MTYPCGAALSDISVGVTLYIPWVDDLSLPGARVLVKAKGEEDKGGGV